MTTRRNTLAALAALPLAAKPFTRPIGLNLYTVRTPLASQPAATYKGIKAAGVELLEVRSVQLLQHAAMIADAGLKPVHLFIDSAIITGAWDEWDAFMRARGGPASSGRPSLESMIELAQKHRIQRIGTSMLLPKEREAPFEAYNRAAELCAKGGVELYYHNHAFEFAGAKGARFIDKLHSQLDKRIRLELDVFWAAITGTSPVDILSQWKGRVKSLHLKDLAPNTTPPTSEASVKPDMFREIGAGTLDFKSILNAAAKAGVEHYLIELDYSPGDPVASVANCVKALRALSL
jgi:sugar phosphate isomerase/epimerase